MIEWLKELWPFVAHAGLGASLMAGLLAAAWFSPVFKKDFVYAAIVVGILLTAYGVGVHDEHVKWQAREKAIGEKVDSAVEKAKTDNTKDPFDDPRN